MAPVTLTVSECFGPTVQGEGPSTGRRAGFVRLGRCNLDCDWCDTPMTWDWKGKNGTVYDPKVELTTWTVESVADKLRAMDVPLVVVTGGEPMLQRKGLSALVEHINFADIEIETNGTQEPWAGLDGVRFNVSPKLVSSGIPRDKAWRYDALVALRSTGRACFKFVIGSAADIDEAVELVVQVGIPARMVWFMPASPFGDWTPDLTGPEVAEAALAAGYNLSGRLHVQLWGQERGR